MIAYLEVEAIRDAVVTGPAQNWSRTGYGEVPLAMKLLVGSRWRRLYVLHYGNGGCTPHIKAGRECMFLSLDAEELVELIFADS